MDPDAFEKLKAGNDGDIRLLYHRYEESFVRFISHTFKCPASKAREIYPEAFSILYFNIKQEKLVAPLKSSILTYLNSTGWNLYHRRYLDKYNREKVPIDNADLNSESRQMVDESLMQQERAAHVHALLEHIGEPCGTLLRKLYINELTYKELSESMAIPETTLRKRKFDCLGKLRRLIDESKLEL